MIRRFIAEQLSYANIVATLALVLVLGGGAYAVTQLPKNSVGTKQVKNQSLRAKDFKKGQLPVGATGPAGPTGLAGPNVLLAGAKKGAVTTIAGGCNSYALSSDPFTVPRTAVLFGAGQVNYTAVAPAGPHRPKLRLRLLTDNGSVATTAEVAAGESDEIGLAVSGLLVGTGDAVFVLQPGTSYRVRVESRIQGNCGGSVEFEEQQVSWLVFPAP
jgi:hypothetical protein